MESYSAIAELALSVSDEASLVWTASGQVTCLIGSHSLRYIVKHVYVIRAKFAHEVRHKSISHTGNSCAFNEVGGRGAGFLFTASRKNVMLL